MNPAPTIDTRQRAVNAARARWGAPKTLRLDDLSDHERWAVVRLVEALATGNRIRREMLAKRVVVSQAKPRDRKTAVKP